jgi:hypothetical protein
MVWLKKRRSGDVGGEPNSIENASVPNELMQDLKLQRVSGHYKNFTRMSPTDFDKLLTMIGPKISKKDTTCTFAGEWKFYFESTL